VLGAIKNVQEILAKNAELTSRVNLSERQIQRLQQENERLKPENARLSERLMLLQEEVRWYKEQFFGRSSQKSPAEMAAEQKLLFNEAEVLAAIEAVMLRMRRAPRVSRRTNASVTPAAARRSLRICPARRSCTI
jgi:predicted nuclease with TOPRIM domain